MSEFDGSRKSELFQGVLKSLATTLSTAENHGDPFLHWKRSLTPKREGEYNPPPIIKQIFGQNVTLEEMRELLTPELERWLVKSLGAKNVKIDW